jgi:putative ABC transport system permease protein
MWLVGVRDLQFRRRRFLIAVIATSVVFAMTLLMAGISHGLEDEVTRIVGSFHADGWVVAEGASGPFTTTRFVTPADVAQVRSAPGVRESAPVIIGRGTVGTTSLTDVNLIGVDPGTIGAPRVTTGRAPRGPGEATVDDKLKVGIGQEVNVSGAKVRVVGKVGNLRFNFGEHTVFLTLAAAQSLAFSGQPLASAVVFTGHPSASLPAGAGTGVRVLSNAEVVRDLKRIQKSGKQSIDIIQYLLWFVAVGIIGSIVYLTALERVRDFAVLKAVGTSNLVLFGALAFQAVTLSVAAGAVAIVLALLLAPLFPFQVDMAASTYAVLALVAVVVGLLASLAGLRRAVGIDPALAFGSA